MEGGLKGNFAYHSHDCGTGRQVIRERSEMHDDFVARNSLTDFPTYPPIYRTIHVDVERALLHKCGEELGTECAGSRWFTVDLSHFPISLLPLCAIEFYAPYASHQRSAPPSLTRLVKASPEDAIPDRTCRFALKRSSAKS